MTIFILAMISVVNFFLQSSVLPYMSISGVVPNTALILIICIAIYKGRYYGGIFGLFIGLIQDILFSSVIGINAFIYFFLGYFVGVMEHRLIRNNIIVPVLFSTVGVIYYNFFYYIFMYFLSKNIPFLSFAKEIILIELIYTSILAIPIYKAFEYNFKEPTISFGNRQR